MDFDLNDTIMGPRHSHSSSDDESQPSADAPPVDTAPSQATHSTEVRTAAQPLVDTSDHMRQILELNKRVMALQNEFDASQRARRELELQRAAAEQELLVLRRQSDTARTASDVSRQPNTTYAPPSSTASLDPRVGPSGIQTTTAVPHDASALLLGGPSSGIMQSSASFINNPAPHQLPPHSSTQTVPATGLYLYNPYAPVSSNCAPTGSTYTQPAPRFTLASVLPTSIVPAAVTNTGPFPATSNFAPTGSSYMQSISGLLPASVPTSAAAIGAAGYLAQAMPAAYCMQPASVCTTSSTSTMPTASAYAANVVTAAHAASTSGPFPATTSNPVPGYAPASSASGAQIAPNAHVYVMQRDDFGREYAQLVPIVSANSTMQMPTGGVQFPGAHVGGFADASTMSSIQMRTNTPSSASAINERRRLHDLPSFSGKPEEWPLFINSYRATTEAYGYSELENLLRLQKCLNGDAKAAVSSMLIHPRHVGQALASLEMRFGHPDLLVKSQIQLAKQLPDIDEEHIEQLVSFATSVQNLAVFLDTDVTQHHLANPALLDELLSKLPMARRIDWASVAMRIAPRPTIKDFALWLSEMARLVNLVAPTAPSKATRSSGSKPPQKSKHVCMLNVSKGDTDECTFCDQNHEPAQCSEFVRLAIKDRWHEVRRLKLCFVCLGRGHIIPSCDHKRVCGVNKCELFHHKMLHDLRKDDRDAGGDDREQKKTRKAAKAHSDSRRKPKQIVNVCDRAQTDEDDSSASESNDDDQAEVTPAVVNVVKIPEKRNESTLLFRVVPVVLHGRDRMIETHALLDEGSSITLIDSDIADQLGLEGPTSELDVQWFSARSTVEGSREVAVGISGTQRDSKRFELACVRTIKNLTLPIQTINKKDLRQSCPHLRRVPISEYKNAKPKILIGLDHHHLGIPLDIRANVTCDGIVAAKTALGWVVYGSSGPTSNHAPVVMHVGGVDVKYERLNELVRAYFSTDDFGVKIPANLIESDDAMRARRILDDTTRRVGRRFETGLLWRSDNVVLPDNYDDAVRRLYTVEAKMRRDANYAALYKAEIESYVAKGYARKMTRAEARTHSSRTWYLPHFAVLNPNKPGKFRMVFDAAAKTHGVSLNMKLLAGPDVNVPLTRLLLQFRLGVVGVCADVKEMYHQVRVREADQDAQRFLWRGGDSTKTPDVYVMTVMTFGSTCSPASAQYVKNVNATEYQDEFPDAADAIRRKHYVDDFVASFETAEEALRVSTDVVEVHSKGGFELRGFVSNSRSVLDGLGIESGTGEPLCMQMELNATEKVLGMCWDTNDDTFMYKTRFVRVQPEVLTGERNPTKREMLSVAMSVFDPFGFLAHFMLESKIILQDLWRIGVGWDERIPDVIEQRWHAWRVEIDRTRLLKVARCFTPHLRTSLDVQLHVFADASEEAFAAVAYWRVVHADGVDISFVLGKTRCAPTQILSVPRLELQAALLATRMMREIRQSLDVQITRTTFWSDSETVLKWLRCDQRKYKQFVAFRVAEILEAAPVSNWHWVPTAMNPADDGTRVQRPPKFNPEARWTRGPEWLRLDENEWPARVVLNADADDNGAEVRRKFVGATSSKSTPNVKYQNFSQFRRVCCAFAYVRRFISYARTEKSQRRRGELGAEEIHAGMLSACRLVQREAYEDEFKTLQDGRPLPISSGIFTLKPYVDDVGLMRVYGRTDAAADDILPYDARRPILLPRQHRFTMLLVRDQHERMAHQLTNATIAAIRMRFWVPQVRVLVRNVQANCLTCRKRTVRPIAPVQGQLPKDRLTPYVRPFTSTGLDFFGPVAVTVGRRREKRWVALFTCLATRAVHLEISTDLSADACMLCVRNLCHLRGTPSRIRCDNGTNFVGARNELADEDCFIDGEAMQREMSTRGIEWVFNCPGNPEAGGIWERLVQSIKRVLQVTLKEEAPRVETLRAHLLEAANMVNSRPLTHLPVAPDEDAALTPNHFLIGGPNAVTMAGPTDAEPSHVKKQWRMCRELSRRFWAQWLRDYLPELTRRSKNYPERAELKPNDLVIMCDGNQPRGQWEMGRIVSVVVGPDGRVRTAEVKTARGVYRRPVSKLAAFDVESGSNGLAIRGPECR